MTGWPLSPHSRQFPPCPHAPWQVLPWPHTPGNFLLVLPSSSWLFTPHPQGASVFTHWQHICTHHPPHTDTRGTHRHPLLHSSLQRTLGRGHCTSCHHSHSLLPLHTALTSDPDVHFLQIGPPRSCIQPHEHLPRWPSLLCRTLTLLAFLLWFTPWSPTLLTPLC